MNASTNRGIVRRRGVEQLATSICLAVVLLLGCSSGDGGEDDSSSTRVDEEDQLAAETGLLTLADFPDGWTEEPAEDESTSAGDEFERELGRCAGVEVEHLFDLPGAEAETGTFTSPDSMVTVDHEIEIPPNVDDVEAFITLLASESVLTCLQDVVPTFLEEEMSRTTDPAETLPSGTELERSPCGGWTCPRAPTTSLRIAWHCRSPWTVHSLVSSSIWCASVPGEQSPVCSSLPS